MIFITQMIIFLILILSIIIKIMIFITQIILFFIIKIIIFKIQIIIFRNIRPKKPWVLMKDPIKLSPDEDP
jgi:hypothetical protein